MVVFPLAAVFISCGCRLSKHRQKELSVLAIYSVCAKVYNSTKSALLIHQKVCSRFSFTAYKMSLNFKEICLIENKLLY